ncbi:peptide chain release factor 1, partial [Pseudomonas sp. 2822-17]
MDPDVISDTKKLRDYSKEQSDIEETVTTYRQYKEIKEQYDEAKSMLKENLDDEMRDMVKMELEELEEQIPP